MHWCMPAQACTGQLGAHSTTACKDAYECEVHSTLKSNVQDTSG